MPGKASKLGHGLAKVLGIDLQGQNGRNDEVTRGESVFSVQTTDTFVEEQPTVAEWLLELIPSGRNTASYLWSLFPFISWIVRYNATWLVGDLIAGLTIGCVVVPQGMAYALLAKLEPQFGLYSSFMGLVIYWIFGTSKDISIGPVAVLSTVVGNVVEEVQQLDPELEAHVIASALSVICGCIVLAIGLLRCGWVVDVISLTSLSAFMTGSAITIAVGQLPALMGITGFSNRESPYLVVINVLRHLGDTKLDAAMGLSALALLYAIRWGLTQLAKRYPKRQRVIFFVNTSRTVVVILLYTLISFLTNMNQRQNPAFNILGKIPRGLQNAAVPQLNSSVLGIFGKYLPATVIVLLVEHIAISKSFGRVNNYVIDPSQEMVAIGVTNVLGPFLGAYPSTGSFTRTAIQSKAGVRTPLAGVIAGMVVLLATYALPAVFFYIPSSSLAAVIIHAVCDLITTPNQIYQFWLVSPLEVVIFFVGVFVSVFASIEDGIYATVAISAAILFYRILKARGRFLGSVRVHSLFDHNVTATESSGLPLPPLYGTFENRSQTHARDIFLPIGNSDGSNPELEVNNPYPGIFIYRFSEGFNYPNANHSLDYLTNYIYANTKRTSPLHYDRKGDQPWNEASNSKKTAGQAESSSDMPSLKAVILDFSSVNNVDITSVQRLIDVRNQLDLYTSPEVVDWHISCINNRWTKRALASAGFGWPTERSDGRNHRWRSIFNVAEIGGDPVPGEAGFGPADTVRDEEQQRVEDSSSDSMPQKVEGSKGMRQRKRGVMVHGLSRPLFHPDLTSALQSAIANVEARGQA